MIVSWIEIFLGMVVIDLIYAIYTKQIQKDNAVFASFSATAIYIINALVVIGFVNNMWLIIPAGLGAFVGTYLGVKINTYKKDL